MDKNTDVMISTATLQRWLADEQSGVVVIDGSWNLPSLPCDAKREFMAAHIKGGRFFDIDAIANMACDLPHMLPTAEFFAMKVGALGISNNTPVVVYDTFGLFSAARVWWMFKAMGHDRVFVLDGGLPKWQNEKRALTALQPPIKATKYRARLCSGWVSDVDAVQAAIVGEYIQVLDARPWVRFIGFGLEPRSGLRCGHIARSRNLCFKRVLNNDGRLLPTAQLRDIFITSGIDLTRPIITTCGSGITAAILNLALARLGIKRHSLYDGSWAEWGNRNDLAINK